ncbi:hypothetical protein B0T25DRAFT_576540 [Lasiosphaeria hispida]|uniref:Peptidase S1 domain-containing protein n=1 Tax=Lasiosphaeria hispida TaxID=260671 RepID=A0AAJ0HWQ4_9PEZI|nr:hypothetical protein B0T25DRAFT_576540 [Lasiosphaeria hispida]
MALNSEPPELEKQLYYHGLPSCPQLVARSNFLASWQPEFEDEHPKIKHISNVGSHDIVNKYDASLRDKIITRLGSTEWTSIDVVRIGYSGSHADPVILWIGVAPGSLASQTGLEIALGCRSELRRAGLHVHCEIREAMVKSLAAVTVIPHQDPEGVDRPISLTSVLGGQSIAGEETSAAEGTLSVYLSLGEGESRIKCALISRYVVFQDDDRRYLHHNNSAEYVIMPGQTTFGEICTEGNEHAAFWQSQGNKYKAQSDVTNQLNAHLGSLKDTASRRIGHILFSPPRLPQSHPDSSDLWLPDYALVLLDRDRFGPDYDKLSNTLWVGQPAYDDVKKMNRGKPFEGVSNEIQSVLRAKANGQWCYVQQWVIIALGDKSFCQKGDSGSAIWDLDGKIGGIIDGGSGGQIPQLDLTYATPTAWILKDIEQKFPYGPVSLL